ncbi:MAG: glycine cleavage system aminomethyltransferase GcvT [Methylococcus sp.]
MTQRTFLYDAHQALGARMVEFGGWEMPVNYGSQIEEHHAVRRQAGMFDISHMLAIDIEGPGTRRFLSRLIANDVAKLVVPGKALYSCMLNEQGGVIDDLIVYFLGDQQFRLIVNAGTAAKDLNWIQSCQEDWQTEVDIRPRHDLAMVAVQGPRAREQVWAALAESRAATEALQPFQAASLHDYFIARTGYTGEDGFEILLPGDRVSDLWARLLELGVTPCGLGARDTLRLEAGMNLYGQDMDEATSPLDAGLAWTVTLGDERAFVGKAALLRDGKRWNFLGLVLLDKGVLRSHQTVHCGDETGQTTSGSFAPTLQQSIALARLPLTVSPGDTVAVAIRDRRVPAKVVKPPFARHGQPLL